MRFCIQTRILALCVSIFFCATAASAEYAAPQQSHGNWFSYSLPADGGASVGVAEAESNNGTGSSLFLIFDGGSCRDQARIRLEDRTSPLPLPSGGHTEYQLRVDDQPVHQHWLTSARTRDGSYDLTVSLPTTANSLPGENNGGYPSSETILSQIREGQDLRVRLEISGKTEVFRYRLDRADDAIERAQSICERYGQPDEEYFNE